MIRSSFCRATRQCGTAVRLYEECQWREIPIDLFLPGFRNVVAVPSRMLTRGEQSLAHLLGCSSAQLQQEQSLGGFWERRLRLRVLFPLRLRCGMRWLRRAFRWRSYIVTALDECVF